MKKIGKERTAGFSLLEVVVAIAIIGLISAPICSSLILAGRIGAHSQAVMEAHLNVRTAVETLMKDGMTEANDAYYAEKFPNVTVNKERVVGKPYYHVTVSDKPTEPLVKVETYVRAVSPKGGGT